MPVQSFGSGWEMQVWKIYDTSPYSWAILSISWDADSTSYSTGGGPGNAMIGGNFGHDEPGTYTFSFKADYSQFTPRPQPDVEMTTTVTLVAVTNLTASTNHIALGTNKVTLTAQTTAAIGDEHITWFAVGGSLSTYSGQTVEFVPYMHGPATVVASCGSSSAGTTLYVYAITGVSASPNPVAVGDTNLVLTATVSPAGCPLPLKWSVKVGTHEQVLTETSLTVTASAGITGKMEIKAELGVTAAYTDLWSVGVKELKYQNPQGGGWDDVSGVSHERVGQELTFKALRDPPDSPAWPAGYPMWTNGNSETGPAESQAYSFSTVSQTLADKSVVQARCGTSTKSASTIVFSMALSNVPVEDWNGRSHSQFGLGETVGVSNNIVPAGLTPAAAGVTWTPENGGVVSGWDGVKGTVQGVTEALTKEFQLLKRGASIASSTMEFIAPTSINYETKSGPTKPANSWFLAKEYRLYILPANVSFSAMQYYEEATWLQGDGVVDLGRVRPARLVGIKAPTDSKGSLAEPVKVELFRKLSDDAQVNGFYRGWQSATIPVGCRIKLPDAPDGTEVYSFYNIGDASYEAEYWGAEPKGIRIKWNADTFEGFFAPALPAASSP